MTEADVIREARMYFRSYLAMTKPRLAARAENSFAGTARPGLFALLAKAWHTLLHKH